MGNIGIKYDLNSKNNVILTHTKAAIYSKNFELITAIDKKVKNRKIFEKIQIKNL